MSAVKLWQSVDGSDRFALEIVASGEADASANLSRLVAGRRRHAAFLIIHPDEPSPAGLEGVARAVSTAKLSMHIGIAVDHSTLRCTGTQRMPDQFGFLLDIHDDGVPFSALADQRIEAVRFSAPFARRAGTSLRAACVFNAMLALSRELGLATLGPSLAHDRRQSIGDTPFDYTDGAGTWMAEFTGQPAPDFEFSR